MIFAGRTRGWLGEGPLLVGMPYGKKWSGRGGGLSREKLTLLLNLNASFVCLRSYLFTCFYYGFLSLPLPLPSSRSRPQCVCLFAVRQRNVNCITNEAIQRVPRTAAAMLLLLLRFMALLKIPAIFPEIFLASATGS